MQFLFVLEIIGTIAFAISGALVGIQKKMDVFGVAVLGLTTAVGGGILRDLILNITPPAAFRNPVFAVIAIVVGGVIFLVKSLANSGGNVSQPQDEPAEINGPKVVSTATVGNSGDILIHSTVRRAFLNAQTQQFDFNSAFSFLQPYVSALDYAVFNAEFSISTNGT